MKNLYFDMDGTIADLYGVPNWLEDLRAERVRPYALARPLLNMSALARQLNKMIADGWTVNVISWTSRGGSYEYNMKVAKAKRDWLRTHLRSVKFREVLILPYGEPKEKYGKGVLFDDEPKNREAWGATAYDVENILETLKGLA